MNKAKPTITIVGAGLAGCFLSILLAKRGYKVHIYEKFSRADICKNLSKRSFNLTFYGYGAKALKKAGIWEEVKPVLKKLDGSITQVTPHSKPIHAAFNHEAMTYYTVQRSRLLEMLIKTAEKLPGISFHFDTSLLSINRQERTMIVQNHKTDTIKTVAADVIIGSDGVNSVVRSSMQLGQDTHHVQEYAPWEYKQLSFPPSLAKQLEMNTEVMYAWTRKNAVILAFPQQDSSYAALCILPKDQKTGFASLTTPGQIKRFVAEQFPTLIPALPVITQALLTNPTGSLVSIYTSPWYYKDFMVLLGDSSHGFLPFYGMGMSVAFGDCLEFVRLLDKYGSNWGKIFPLYQESRKKHTDVIANLSKESFLRFRRHKKADYSAVYDRFESILYKLFPKYFPTELFVLVAADPDHSADSLARHNKQRKIAKYLGVPLLVGATTGAVRLVELASTLPHKTAAKS
jgi:kynurenine 3-monooxygenase